MRILTGRLKGLVLNSPKGKLRPTQDKVRKAIFDILAEVNRGADFLELFAGSGAVGIEALSCGAGFVCFVENERDSIRLLRENLSKVKLSNREIIPFDAFKVIEQFAGVKRRFDIIFADPPYYPECMHSRKNSFGTPKQHRSSYFIRGQDISLAKKILISLSSYDILKPSGFIIIQHYKKDVIPETTDSLEIFKQKIYGDTVVSFYRRR